MPAKYVLDRTASQVRAQRTTVRGHSVDVLQITAVDASQSKPFTVSVHEEPDSNQSRFWRITSRSIGASSEPVPDENAFVGQWTEPTFTESERTEPDATKIGKYLRYSRANEGRRTTTTTADATDATGPVEFPECVRNTWQCGQHWGWTVQQQVREGSAGNEVGFISSYYTRNGNVLFLQFDSYLKIYIKNHF